jgi:hypothetical protein
MVSVHFLERLRTLWQAVVGKDNMGLASGGRVINSRDSAGEASPSNGHMAKSWIGFELRTMGFADLGG